MTENKFTQINVKKETHREIDIMATLKTITMRNLIEEAVELYKIKHRLTDRVIEFMRD